MVPRTIKGMVFLGLFGLLTGCQGGLAVNYYEADPPPRVVHVDRGHVCGPGCHDHYWDGGKIVVIRDRHRHGPGCGHHFDGNHWVIAVSRDRPGPDRVVRIPAPPGEAKFFVYDRRSSKWLKVSKGHTHGPKCGHVVIEGHWCNP